MLASGTRTENGRAGAGHNVGANGASDGVPAAVARDGVPSVRGEPGVPRPLSSFLGRAQELQQVGQALRTSRLLTMAGPGGVGKTRLALEAAARCAAADERVCFADLAAAGPEGMGADGVARAVACAMGMEETSERHPSDGPVAAPGSGRTLLVLDNCEHVVGACAALAERLLRGAPALRILATSREPLGVDGEVVWRKTTCLR